MKSHIFGIIGGLVFLTFGGNSIAQNNNDLDKCISDNYSTADRAQCLQKIYKAEDVRLNALYKRAISEAKNDSADSARDLKNSELAWIKFRDGWCNFQAKWEGGTLASVARPYCLASVTRQRNADLSFYAGEPKLISPWKN